MSRRRPQPARRRLPDPEVRRREEGEDEPPEPDIEDLIYALNDNLGRADTFITALEDLSERPCADQAHEDADSDDTPGRRRNHVAHLIESTKLAVRAAGFAGSRIAAAQDKRRWED